MYLDYTEYESRGGALEQSAFVVLCKRAESKINACAGGRTGQRIKELQDVPEAVKDCVFLLIDLLSTYDSTKKQITSESQSQGGQSESYSYVQKSAAEIESDIKIIIDDSFYGNGIGYLLYRGSCI